MTTRRLVFVDVDGTLIDHHQQLAPSVPDAISRARGNGHLVLLCTGRSRREIPATVADIGFDGAITAGGGFVEFGGEVVAGFPMPGSAVTELVRFFRERDVEYNFQGFDDVYPSEGLFERVRPLFEADIARNRDAAASRDVKKLEKRMAYRGPVPTEGIAKATFFGSDAGTFARVRDGLGDRFHVITGTIPYLGEAGGEVSLPGMHKGAAIARLAERLGVPMTHTIGIGDSHNDVEMLAMCGLGIAMGNAPELVKAHADEVTTGVDADGVWNAFANHGLL
ncbi:Cof-type HAD-IIB family hydrolase [Microbacterium sp. BK668]|uniref:Cof-type HAD-IIB family hydrolase n=1 Tax=Microbacterium sp. BK668 TaxID=2512118 RepID=UPI0010D203BC|nr:Cof-type HAD-IIB family hydrolase [Microbacterium sp. BK668]TDN90924.1 Cof subfamily protein (haloacid dehalogenase superfamily)/HAD superfamily hydrolase (TIGR01484 family) [Microbacterium sp. BK668]